MIYSTNKKNKDMKYVKLFESWLQTVNEAIDLGKLNDLGLRYESDADYTKGGSDVFAKHIIKATEKMLANAPEDYKPKLEFKTRGKDITISTKKENESTPNTFKFRFDKEVFTLIGVPDAGTKEYILGITGSANVFNEFVENTTYAQFIYSVVTGKDIKPFNQNDDSFKDAIEQLIFIASGKKPAILSGKTGSKNISKMTADEFYALPEKTRMEVLKTVLKSQFILHKTRRDSIFVVTPSQELAKKYKMTADDATGYYLAIKLEKPEDGNESMSNIPILYGESDSRGTDDKEIYDPYNAERVTKVESPTKTTLGAFIFGLNDLVANEMKYTGSDKKVTTATTTTDIKLAVKPDDSDATKKKAEDAWTKKGGPADMSLRAEASKEATA